MKTYRQTPKHKAYMKTYNKAYFQKPEVKTAAKVRQQTAGAKATAKAYKESPKGKAILKAYRESPKGKADQKRAQDKYCESIKGRAKRKAYNQTPEAKEVARLRAQRPEVKAAKKSWAQTPEYRKRDNARRRRPKYKAVRKTWASQPGNRFAVLSRKRIHTAFHRAGLIKSVSTEELLGCPLSRAYEHFLSTFTEGMTEEIFLTTNRIHIDHIRPCASFDLTDIEQQKQCFHYTNLQALWAEDNLTKNDKMDWVKEGIDGDLQYTCYHMS